jgi:hypothetical protein
MDKTQTVVLGHKWTPAFRIRIAHNKERVQEEIESDATTIKVLSDGSCIERGVGAAAILCRNNVEEQRVRLYLGMD